MKRINILTPAQVRHVTEPGRHFDGAGLYLEISKGSGRGWVFM
jgi:hypothetical protein